MTTPSKHGLRYTPEYTAWDHMKRRCYNPKTNNYSAYGGRGIKVCEEWLSSFESFYNDMGKKPSSKHSLDRIDNDGNYEPKNCWWATAVEQTRNTRRNVYLLFNGESKTISEWSMNLKIPLGIIQRRIGKQLSIEKILTPIHESKHNVHDAITGRYSKK